MLKHSCICKRSKSQILEILVEEQAALGQHVAEAGWSVVRTASGELVTQIAV